MSEIVERVSRALDQCGQERGHRIPAAMVTHFAIAAIDAIWPSRPAEGAQQKQGAEMTTPNLDEAKRLVRWATLINIATFLLTAINIGLIIWQLHR